MIHIIGGLFGLAVLVGLGFAFSTNRGKINWRTVAMGLVLQMLLGLLLLKVPQTASAFEVLTYKIRDFLKLADIGGSFVFSEQHMTPTFTPASDFGQVARILEAVPEGETLPPEAQQEIIQKLKGIQSLEEQVKSVAGELESSEAPLDHAACAALAGRLNGIAAGRNSATGSLGVYVFAIRVAPTIIFFSAFISVLYYLGIIQKVIVAIAFVMRKTMGTSGAETLSVSANIFVGQTEAPFLIKPFLDHMTYSEVNAVMVGGFATIAGGVLAAYIGMGISPTHLIVASVMSAPAAMVMAKLMVPETAHSETAGDAKLPKIQVGDNLIDAAARGTTDGLKLAVNVMAMLIAFISLIAVADWILGAIDAKIDGDWLGGQAFAVGSGTEFKGWFPGSLRTIFGTVFAPIAWVMGVPWSEAAPVGNLLGTKICVNEFVAYAELSKAIGVHQLSERSVVIATYALCGFANFSSIGIQIGGISAICPGRRTELAKLGLRAMFGGALASWMTATVAGMLL